MALALALGAALAPSPAQAGVALEPPTDCPPGSVGKASGNFAWCEPSVCLHDGNCTPGDLCRTVSLCVEVGTLADAGQAGEKRLAATQRCAPGGACPSGQVCSVKDRCLSKSVAQKLGVLEAPKPAPPASAAAEDAPPKRSACGCEVAGGTRDGALPAGLLLGTWALLAAARRRRVHA